MSAGLEEGLQVGVAVTAFGLGMRHGIDWDHLAAITDLTSSASDRRGGLRHATLYAAGHALVVFVLGLLAIVAGARLPQGIDRVMEVAVGVSLIALAAFVVVSLLRDGRAFTLRSRWTLVASLVGRVRVGHATHEPFTRQGRFAAFAIGMLHGVGAETPTQIVVLAAAAGAGGRVAGVAFLGMFLAGLLCSNTLVALGSSAGLFHRERAFPLYAALSVVIAVTSFAVGVAILVGRGDGLPSVVGCVAGFGRAVGR